VIKDLEYVMTSIEYNS